MPRHHLEILDGTGDYRAMGRKKAGNADTFPRLPRNPLETALRALARSLARGRLVVIPEEVTRSKTTRSEKKKKKEEESRKANRGEGERARASVRTASLRERGGRREEFPWMPGPRSRKNP